MHIQKILLVFSIVFTTLFASLPVSFAQNSRQINILRADAGEDRSVKVGSEIIFDASDSFIPADVTPVYKWDMGNNNFRFGLRPIFSYEQPGIYRVKLTVEARDGSSFSVDEAVVEVFEEQAVVIARTKDIPRNTLNDLSRKIQDSNIAAEEVFIDENFPSESAEREELLSQLVSVRNVFKKADMIVVVDRFGAETLIEYAQIFPEDIVNRKIAFVLTAGSLRKPNIDLAQLMFNVIHPKEVRVEYLSNLPQSFFYPAVDTEIQYIARELGQRPHAGFIDIFYQFNTRLISLGLSTDVLYLLYLILLIGIFGIALRKILGISVIGLQTLILSLIAIFSLGFLLSIFIFTLFFIIYYLMRRLYQINYMTFFPSQFLNMVLFILVTIIGIFVIHSFYPQLSLNMTLLLAFIVLSISANRLSLSVVSDSVPILFGKYIQEIIFFLFNILLFSIELFRLTILMYPEIYILLVIIGAVSLEKYTGLRLSEYIRFSSILKDREEE